MKYPTFAVLALLSTAAGAGDDLLNHGFAISNRSPVVDGYGVSVQQPDLLPAPGTWRGGIQIEVANSYSVIDSVSETSIIDGETAAVTFSLLRGFASGWALGIELPVVNQSGGFLDGVIDDWHDTFGLEEFIRSAPEDRLLYRYTRGGETRFELDRDVTSFGDLTVFLGRSFANSEGAGLSAWFGLKLPTGDAAEFSGSGAADFSARLQGFRALGQYGTLFGGLGVAWLGKGELLPELQNDLVGSLTAGFSWQRWTRVALKIQVDAQSAVYDDTALRQFGDAAVQLSLGGSIRIGERSVLDVAVVEDEWKVQVSPDFGVLVRWRTY